MIWRTFRRHGVIPLLLVLSALAYWKMHPRAPKFVSVGYIADRDVTLWNTLAQVKQPVAEMHYGDRVEVVREEGTSAQVVTASGKVGWMLDAHQLMDSELWGRSIALLAHARTLPEQARGHTKTVSNVRIEPGRDGQRIFQFMRGTPVIVLERAVEDIPQARDEKSQVEKDAADSEQKPNKEDWLLVLRAGDASSGVGNPASAEDSVKSASRASGGPVSGGPQGEQASSFGGSSSDDPIAGWVLARFIEFNLPGPVRDYASSADLHVVAWFELNRVPNGSGGEVPQYLVAGSRGGEGQPCDFTMLRVYTWGVARKRYETAYVESDLCGRLPIRVSQGAKGPEFQFTEIDENSAERKYVMQQTAVRRVKEAGSGPSSIHK